ncbi:MAG: hypothetical protein QOC89_2425, partial [Paraburkholderia sp.]|nr:hypothetical protein [Paraburkholderia sp.]
MKCDEMDWHPGSQKRDSGRVIQWSIDFRENRGDCIRVEHGMDLGPMSHNYEEEFQWNGAIGGVDCGGSCAVVVDTVSTG